MAAEKPLAKVLVVEDDESLQRLLRLQLTSKGFEVIPASNGLRALVMLETLRPDIILCDLNMPELDGFGFVEAIKSNPQTRSIPVAFLTASSDEKDFQRGLKLGARYFITKPFNMNELAWKLKRLLTERAG